MENNTVFITITGLGNYSRRVGFMTGDVLVLKKENDNYYDDEAIAIYDNNVKCGYVANSVHTVIRGTQSAGRIYDKIENSHSCKVKFIGRDFMIAQIV